MAAFSAGVKIADINDYIGTNTECIFGPKKGSEQDAVVLNILLIIS